ncbi:MAG: tRNA uridine-5-carboxymethylaminomethyl(34) synthesis enzyme MnmG, partial [Oscillospiraceae bacterium]|nr:tRNA uridine-5-carboxymethylaminomethyl(34) synthesis enzyme MnmG [Oscillospiraceae bacterium]
MTTLSEALRRKSSYKAGDYDVAVVGAGHAGCEAACAAAGLGLSCVLFDLHLDAVANLPCNPSIGGTAKGQLVREIDALGGRMGKMADESSIQTRMLNRSKGPAVFSPRAQIDRKRYSQRMKEHLERTENLDIRQGEITDILTDDEEGRAVVCGVMTRSGAVYGASAVIISSGTYMEARIIMGEVIIESGPDASFPSIGLSKSLADLGLPIQRFKTGTPVRINARGVDFSKMDKQGGEDDMPPFSFEYEMLGNRPDRPQMPCWNLWTTPETKSVIEENIGRSPLFSGTIEGTGPRYCPSIEDKFVKFKDKERHQVFVEPMGEDTCELYLQGMSTSMPEDVQIDMIRSLPGLQNAHIQRSAYAIEYDCVDPTSLFPSLETRSVSGLFTAGQINGSSGYEEAAAQGLIAGINAVRYVRGEAPFVLNRSEAYIGVLIDDLVTKGTSEPYRMMTSRAEYRLFLRQDNADERLTPYGYEIGLISEERYRRFTGKMEAVQAEIKRLSETFLAPSETLTALMLRLDSTPANNGISLADLLKRPQIHYADLSEVDGARPQMDPAVIFSVEVAVKYEGYLKLEKERIAKFKALENKVLPQNLSYN